MTSGTPVAGGPNDPGPHAVPLGGPFLTVRHEWGDILVGLALLTMAIWFFVGAANLEDFSGGGIGAAAFPQALAVLLGLGVLVIIVSAFRRLASHTSPRLIVVRRYGHVAVGMALLVVFPALMEGLGYYLAMAVWLAAFLVLAGIRHPIHVVAYVGGFLLFTKVVFETILGTPLP